MPGPLSERFFSLRPQTDVVHSVAELVERLRDSQATEEHHADKRRVVVAHATDSVAAAHQLFRSLDLHHLPVVEDEKIVGIVSSTDLLEFFSEDHEPPEKVSLAQIMTKDPQVIAKTAPVGELINLLASSSFRAVPVVGRSDEIWAIVTTRDLVRFLALSYD